jgi:hypothetical protein
LEYIADPPLVTSALRKPGTRYTHESHARSHRVSIVTARSDLLDLTRRGWLERQSAGRMLAYQPIKDLEARLLDEGSGDGR